jgi:hypothetical protein
MAGFINFITVGLTGFMSTSNVILISDKVAIQSSLSPILFTEDRLPGEDDQRLTKSTVIFFNVITYWFSST